VKSPEIHSLHVFDRHRTRILELAAYRYSYSILVLLQSARIPGQNHKIGSAEIHAEIKSPLSFLRVLFRNIRSLYGSSSIPARLSREFHARKPRKELADRGSVYVRAAPRECLAKWKFSVTSIRGCIMPRRRAKFPAGLRASTSKGDPPTRNFARLRAPL
jgi:hypothetical protein